MINIGCSVMMELNQINFKNSVFVSHVFSFFCLHFFFFFTGGVQIISVLSGLLLQLEETPQCAASSILLPIQRLHT